MKKPTLRRVDVICIMSNGDRKIIKIRPPNLFMSSYINIRDKLKSGFIRLTITGGTRKKVDSYEAFDSLISDTDDFGLSNQFED